MTKVRVYGCVSLCVVLISFLPVNEQKPAVHPIVFCGEYIPVDDDFIGNRLMGVIKSQVNYVNLPSLRQSAALYFDYVASVLKQYGIPEDFKYLPIVESGFKLVSSGAGARGFWQLMPETARGLGLRVDLEKGIDDRDNIELATHAACRVLRDYYQYIRKRHKKASWILAAAAYNFGIGNMSKAISSQGENYFTMSLNAETALYVYKIIAIKELFEYPEVYMKNFGYNIFAVKKSVSNLDDANTKKADGDAKQNSNSTQPAVTLPVQVDFSKSDAVESLRKSVNEGEVAKVPVFHSFSAYIKGKYKGFKDYGLVTIRLGEDIETQGFFRRSGTTFTSNGWIIDGRVFVEMPYGRSLQLFDNNFKKGVSIENLKNGMPVILKLEVTETGVANN